MANAKLTPWFPPSIKPVHPGCYPTVIDGWQGFSWFDGRFWGYQTARADKAHSKRAGAARFMANQNKRWRGLAQKPA